MSTIHSIQLFVALNLFVIGFSHLLRPKIWIEFFEFLYERGNVGNIFNAMLALGMGSIIVTFHFVWQWPIVLITLYGLSQLIKGFIYLSFPSIGLNSIKRVNEKTQKFRWAGLLFCLLSILVGINLYLEDAFL